MILRSFMKIKLLVLVLNLCICLIGTNSMAQEVVKGFDEKKDLPRLNKILRRSVRRLNAIENGVSLTSGVSGILPLLNGGTGAALVDPGADRILFWDDSEGIFEWLTIGPGLTITATTITSSNPPISVTSISAASASSDISLEASKHYLVVYEILQNTTGANLEIVFDNDTGASDYAWIRKGDNVSGTTLSSLDAGDSADDSIVLEFSAPSHKRSGHFYVDTKERTSNHPVHIHGSEWITGDATGPVLMTFGGDYTDTTNNGAVFDFRVSAGTMTGNIYLYEYDLTP